MTGQQETETMAKSTDNNSDGNADPPRDPAWCIVTCKYDGKEKRGNKSLVMTQCCHCAQWFHDECMGLTSNRPDGIWLCPSCKRLPIVINDIKSIVLQLKDSLDACNKRNDELCKQNDNLQQQVTALTEQVQKLVKQGDSGDVNGPTLFLGDSLIRDVDQSKLINTKVKSLHGAKVAEVLQHLQKDKSSYERVVICAATNDCSSDQYDGEKVTDTFKQVIAAASQKVSTPKNVTVSSIPPRTDDEVAQ